MQKKTLIAISLVLLVILAALTGGGLWLKNTHVFVNMRPYPKDAESLDLGGKQISLDHYQELSRLLPECEISWDVPFQGTHYPSDARKLTVTTLTPDDMARLALFENLEEIDAGSCRDYEALMELKEAYPHVDISYNVTIGGNSYPNDAKEVALNSVTEEDLALLELLPELTTLNARGCTDYAGLAAFRKAWPEVALLYDVTIGGETYTESTTELTLKNVDMAELEEKLPVLANLQRVHLVEPETDAARLVALRKANPKVEISWEKTLLGKTHSSNDTEIDYSGLSVSPSDVEAAMAYYPDAEKVIMADCGIDNETMAAFREKMRPSYKVVWKVMCRTIPVRTDDVFFHPYQHDIYNVFDDDLVNLKYCEDMICVDLGHNSLHHCDWAAYMPNLKYLILAWNIYLDDITGLSNCKELVYLELGWTQVRDFTPLLGCTKLEDLHLKYVYSDPGAIHEMTWLKHIFWEGCKPVYQQALTESLPDTYILFGGENSQTKQWRKLPNYYAQRDVLGMGYMDQY